MSDPILLTPGPLTTSATTRHAMQQDWGSWDAAFNQLTATVCADLVDIARGGDQYVCVPMQGSGTFAVEAALGTLVPRDGVVLVPDNGAYCARILKILGRLGIDAIALPFGEDAAVDPAAVEAAFAREPRITHVALVHLETSAGILNPLDAIAAVCRRHGKRLIVDAMSSFGALPIVLADSGIDALISASGKCLEGVPGMGFAIVRRDALEASEGNSRSLALDLHDQYAYLRKTGQWRFTPPTHVVAALRAALDQYLAEGGQPARGARYAENCRTLVEAMRALGFTPFLDARVQAPVIVTFHAPAHPAYDFRRFYDAVRDAGFILYPGKLTQLETFRVGCIGAIDSNDIRRAVAAIAQAVESLGIGLLHA
ncbi:2-aminoethylphosphonate--pyruvate transaminase [Burkholderia pseudomultivorans]|uniref:2-aminoethylphosphonate--pyruvate transaminase n=1 Tax=Burkholderia pseudomultivorans TaxID=1207504 RepID=A0A6P2L0A3_9BURK|nr:2-aminoethylphosphonate--pyruvate transaminase [Burkholderia pseudomultivorans]MDR8729052.1 2-aminoethylphosphonate--pyruvate transaminase [Burkholderia pseudomultivorans]MDR8734989.1 2-aminoethylphosphonate--pyruvate transaminase [Burkholderia pseudomultivorans]MDR8740742.1 2-aminoethylphosphonate--pyruvate transaminase [Burkholderia pseudomultivorans]MDR8751830.1 2-aminoethylphosphonate--pyruvate transaminase [Burkholderia pseudomultivorans]MDR8777156.1 2-aminoethylphosphonate--pyruvate t